jgi:aryl-alcohol dehydrogenase-like predicted oxidoreductase
VQSEYSIFTRDVEDGRLAAMETVGASLVAYSPVGRGILTGTMKRDARPAGDADFRNTTVPRFNEDNYTANLDLVKEIESVAAELGAKPAQIALAWVLSRAPIVHAIPGTTRIENLKTNLATEHVVLSAGQVKRLNALAERVAGARYTPTGLSAVNR